MNIRRRGTVACCILLALGLAGRASASTVDFSFNNELTPPSSGVIAGTAPFLNLSITDLASGEVALTVSTDFTGAGGSQTLTGLWLNIPSIENTVSSLSISNPSGTGQAPFSFTAASNPSTYTNTQSTLPGGATANQTGYFNIFLKFPNSAPGFKGTETETFDLSGTGLSALAFYALSLPKAAGDPSFYSLATVTNATGAGGSGIAYLYATPVPIPATVWLLLAGLASLGGLTRRARLIYSW